MPSRYMPKPPVECHNCGASMIKRRNSKSGYYYCPKEECQAARREAWFRDRSTSAERDLQDQIELERKNSSAFLAAALRAERVKCSACGLLDAIPGYAHLRADGGGCSATGGAVRGVTINHALAVWPDGLREYGPVL